MLINRGHHRLGQNCYATEQSVSAAGAPKRFSVSLRAFVFVVMYSTACIGVHAGTESVAGFVQPSPTTFSEQALYPAGYRNRTSGDLTNVGTNGNVWSSAPNSVTNAYNLNFNSGTVNPTNNSNRANGFSVRPVQHLLTSGFLFMNLTRDQIHNLTLCAYLDARRHERNKASQLEFESDLESNIKDLADDLFKRTYRPSPPICFVISEPTLREVFAPKFRDRIVSHVLFNMLNPFFDRLFIYDSFSCRKGKGTLFGIERFEHHIRSATDNYMYEAFVLSIDISGYFMNINKPILYNIVCHELEKFRNRSAEPGAKWGDVLDYSFIDYLNRIMLFRNPTEGCVRIGSIHDWDPLPHNKSMFYSPLATGITIGDQMSQLFSNIYLNIFDHYCKREMQMRHYCRYVDDGRAIDRSKMFLEDCIEPMRVFLKERLLLNLHPRKVTIRSTKESNLFLGACVRDYRRYARNDTLGRFRKTISKLEDIITSDMEMSLDGIYGMQAHINSCLGYLQHFDEFRAKDAILANSPLNGIFIFAPDYQSAQLRPDICEALMKV